MKSTQLRIALIIAIVAISSVTVQTAIAKSNNGNANAWGNGATAQVHTGPSGVSVRPGFIERLENRRDKIVTRLENNNRIPEPQKSNIIDRIKGVFDRLIEFFS